MDVLKIFEKTGGILKGHFLLTSGRHSDTYMQCAKLFAYPNESERLCKELAKALKKYKADYVVAPAVGGIIIGYEVARQVGIPNFFAERQDGVFALRRGFELPKGSRVIVVEDVITTGGSVKEVVELINKLESTVVCVGCIVDRSNGGVDFGVPLHGLLAVDVKSYDADKCPLCKDGSKPYKPGSRT